MSELDNQRVLLSLLDQVQEDPEGILADTGLQPVLEKGEEVPGCVLEERGQHLSIKFKGV